MLNIRRADLNDLEVLVQMRLEFFREVGSLKREANTTALAEATRQYLIKKMPRGEFMAWIAEAEGQIVGISGLALWERPPLEGNLAGMEAYLTNMYTTPEWRGKGVATALLKETIEFVKGTEARRIWLRSTEASKSVYEKAGFSPITSQMELVW